MYTVARFFPSSKACSSCGHTHKTSALKTGHGRGPHVEQSMIGT
ncbi:MAG: hypothetical protein KTR25_20020 [Myxococcales bacterium]|nr:hypothetical protein [Myxococcales bacterium]